MTTPVLSTASASAVSTLLAQLKAEQAKLTEQTQTTTTTTAKPQDLKSLGAQIVRNLEATQSDAMQKLFGGSDDDEDASDPLAALFSGSDSAAATSASSGSTLKDLAAQLAKTEPGPAGDAARAKLLAKLSASASASAQTSASLTQGASLFSFLG